MPFIDASYTPQYLAIHLVAGFAGFAYKWWRWLPSKTKQDFLNAGDADQQILKALGAQFVGPKKKLIVII